MFPLALENNNNTQALTFSLDYFLSLKKNVLMCSPNARGLGFPNSSSIIATHFPFIIKKKSHNPILQTIGKPAWSPMFLRIFEGITFFLFSVCYWACFYWILSHTYVFPFIKVPKWTSIWESALFIFYWLEIAHIPQLEQFSNLSFSPTNWGLWSR